MTTTESLLPTVDDDNLDEQIVQACNDLLRYQHMSRELKTQQRRERSVLLQTYLNRHDQWHRQRANRVCPDLSVYAQACAKVFASQYVPAFCAGQQAQLCWHVHLLTMDETQLLLCTAQLQDLESWWRETKHKITELQMEFEAQMLNDIVVMQQEIFELQDRLERVGSADYGAVVPGGASLHTVVATADDDDDDDDDDDNEDNDEKYSHGENSPETVDTPDQLTVKTVDAAAPIPPTSVVNEQ